MPDETLIRQVREGDYDRFLAIQLAPTEKRASLYAIAALSVELARIAEIVSEPLIGHIRLAWWREALEEIEAAKPPRNHPTVLALAELHQKTTNIFPLLHEMIEARTADIDNSLLAEENDWRNYCNGTSGALHLAFARVLDESAAATQEALIRASGQAFAMIGLLRAIPFMTAQGWLRFPQARLDAFGLASLEPANNLSDFTKSICDNAFALVPENKLGGHLRMINALNALTRSHAESLRKCGDDPYLLRPSKLASVWQITKTYIN